MQFDIQGHIHYDVCMKTIKYKIWKHKKFIVFLLVASFLISMPTAAERVWATSNTEQSSEEKEAAKEKREEAQEGLDKVEDEIDELEEEQKKVEKELKYIRSQLSSLMEQQEQLAIEMENTQADIEQTTLDLELARAKANEQYESMKLRIQYMYENSTADSMWTAILQADGITDMLNRVEYISTIYESDRELTEQYKETVAQVEEKERQLVLKMDELLVKQETFIGQQMEIEEMIASLEIVNDEFETQLASARAQADSYRQTISQQNQILQNNVTGGSSPSYNGGQNVSGEELVNFAMQFVGNPYVWGGNSLTKGCDCSGFVHLVYKNFGYKTVRYSMSFLYEGTPVSRADVRPGDIVVYAMKNGIGHVAIYAGNGKIVEAQSKSTGITAYRSIDCREIVGIRRILKN